jgi:hypothetical protein
VRSERLAISSAIALADLYATRNDLLIGLQAKQSLSEYRWSSLATGYVVEGKRTVPGLSGLKNQSGTLRLLTSGTSLPCQTRR